MSDPILSIRGVSKHFGGLKAVDDVSFDVLPQQIFGIAGPNGSGKSTLFNVITKVPFGPTRGAVSLNRQPIHTLSPHRIALTGIARTFQRENVFASLSAIDNVLVAVESYVPTAPFSEQLERAEEALNLVGFPANMHNSPADSVPIFYRKQLMIASALALQPKVLLLDEPASSLTGPEIERMKQIILRVRDNGMTVVLIEHVLALLMEVSDRLLVLDQGRTIAIGDPVAVVKDPTVIEAYLGVAHE